MIIKSNQQAIESMKIIEAIKGIIYKLDLLNSGSLLRIKGQPEHRTLIGGFISIALMIALMVVFSNKIIDTLNKVNITSSTSTTITSNPTPLNLTSSDSGTFMAGFQIYGINLNEGNRYFDVVLRNIAYNYGIPNNLTREYSLQPCTKDHWNKYSLAQDNFEKLRANNWLCLPKNTNFQLGGKYTSSDSKTLEIAVMKCSNNSQNSRSCAPQADIDQLFLDYGNLFFSIYFLNPLINPESESYLQYYLEDANYIVFSSHSGEECRLFVEDYQIQTDQSIFPITNIMSQSGGIVESNGLKSTYAKIGDIYAIYYLQKSPTSISYNRSFQKLDEVFSYIGGLFGIILIAFFLVSNYNTYKFEINIAGYLYKSVEKAEKRYNIFHYFGQSIYALLKMLKFQPKWEKLNFYNEARQQMLKQLDILYLLKRVNFIEKSLTFLFTDHQLKGLHLANQLTLSEATNMRRNYKLKAILKKEIQAMINFNPNNQQNQLQNHTIINDKQFIAFTKLKEEKVQCLPNINELMAHSFDSDQYSSEESSNQDDQENVSRKIVDSIKQLRIEEKENETSQKILRNIDTRLQHLVDLAILKQNGFIELENQENLKNNSFESLHEIENNGNTIFLFEDRVKQSSIPKGENIIKNEHISIEIFSKLKVVHPSEYFAQISNDQA